MLGILRTFLDHWVVSPIRSGIGSYRTGEQAIKEAPPAENYLRRNALVRHRHCSRSIAISADPSPARRVP
jgi:hypothetical protein